MKPCNNCDKKPDCRIICKAFAKWLDDDSPQGPILENKPIKLNVWCGRKGKDKFPKFFAKPTTDKKEIERLENKMRKEIKKTKLKPPKRS
jgi:hypothetical protein